MKKKKKDHFFSLVVLVMISSMVFYQFLPFISIKADDDSAAAASTSDKSSVSSDDGSSSSNDSSSEDKDKSDSKDTDSASNDSDKTSDTSKTSDSTSDNSQDGSKDSTGTDSLNDSKTENQTATQTGSSATASGGQNNTTGQAPQTIAPTDSVTTAPVAPATDTNTQADDSANKTSACACNDTPKTNDTNTNSDNTDNFCACPETKIENNNDTTLQNDASANSDTGNNTAGAIDADTAGNTADANNTATNNSTNAPDNTSPVSAVGTATADTNTDNSAITATDNNTPSQPGSDPAQTQTDPSTTPSSSTSSSNTVAPDNSTAVTPAGDSNDTQTQATSDPAITTGNAVAQTDTVDEVNTNVVTDNGQTTTDNVEGTYIGDINLLDLFNNVLSQAKNLNAQNASAVGSITIDNNNNAQITNSVSATANTGNNSATVGNGSSITTGDASATANVVNVANKNLVGNNWVFAIVNVFGKWIGDLIVPGEGLLTVPGTDDSGQLSVTNDNQANIENNVASDANTGGNEINSNGNSANISTGTATSASNVKNIINTNITKNNWFLLLINNMGSWVGEVMQGNSATGSYSPVYAYDFGTDGTCANCLTSGSLDVNNRNTASITNNVSADGNTGNNEISGADGSASIKTGNASAWANVVNFVNTNIVGDNWLFGMVNIMGTWHGNVDFAYPDLDVTLSGDKNPIEPGNNLTYTISCENKGKAKADDASVMLSLPDYLTYESDTSGENHSGGGKNLTWNFSGLNPGDKKSFTVTADLAGDTPANVTSLESAAGVKTDTKEVDLGNNTASLDTAVDFPQAQISIVNDDTLTLQNVDSDLSIERDDSNSASIHVGAIFSKTIKVSNTGKSTVYNIVVKEKVKDPNGNQIVEYQWPISELKKGQKALIQYQAAFNGAAQLGSYEYVASAQGVDPMNKKVKTESVAGWLSLFGAIAQASTGTGDQIIPPADAAGPQPQVLGTDTQKYATKLPFWIFLLALVAYFLAINWSMIRKKSMVVRSK